MTARRIGSVLTLAASAVVGLAFFTLFDAGYPELAPFAATFAGALVAAALTLRVLPPRAVSWVPPVVLLAVPVAFVPLLWLYSRLGERPSVAAFAALPLFAGGLAALALPPALGRTSAGAYALAAAAAAAIAFTPPALAGFWRPRPEARFPAIDEAAGGYGGVGIGAAPAEVVRAHGKPLRVGLGDPNLPTGVDENDVVRVPISIKAGPRKLAYSDVIFYLREGTVAGFQVTSPGAETRRGVEIGDLLDDVRRAYPELACGETDGGHDFPDPFPYCTGTTAPGVHVWFGGDPVSSITIHDRPLS